MPMRIPLTELPLDIFVPLEHRTSVKRPLSPSATLLSPSKRRILSAEGLFSPDRRRNHTPAKQLFSDLVGAPQSPARKLDFTTLSHPSPRKASTKHARDASPRPETPVSRSGGAPRLAPSPELACSSTSGASASSSRREPCETALRPSSASTLPPPMFIPREMPTFSDRQSIHWPGFDVHPDTHIAIPTSQSIAQVSNLVDASDADDHKENVRPSRRAGKRMALVEEKTTKNPKISRTESHAHGPSDVNAMSVLTPFPSKKALTPHEKQEERRRRRLVMVHEQDEEANEEEDVDEQL